MFDPLDPKLREPLIRAAMALGMRPPPNTPQKDYVCPECGYQTTAIGGLHQGRFGIIQTLRCLDCQQAFDAPCRLYRHVVEAIAPGFEAPDGQSVEARALYGERMRRMWDEDEPRGPRRREEMYGESPVPGPNGQVVDALGVHPVEGVTLLRRPSYMALSPHQHIMARWLTLPGWVYKREGGYGNQDVYVRYSLCPADPEHIVDLWSRGRPCPACGRRSLPTPAPTGGSGEQTPPLLVQVFDLTLGFDRKLAPEPGEQPPPR